jgi:uncharacterized lipoprotein YddW (UPF0748 family)
MIAVAPPARRPDAERSMTRCIPWPGAAALVALCTMAAACGDSRSPVGPPTPPPPPAEVPSPPQEARALWISRWDWADEAQLRALLENAASANFNIIYLQVRGRADAYYRSNLEPWAHRPPAFVLGQDPGWDPLAIAIDLGRSRGMEVHAWINALIGWCTQDPIPETVPRHILLDHPEWRMISATGGDYVDGCTWITPGDPAARAHLAAVSADITRNYDVGGIHLDFIRYPYANWSYDDQSLAAWEQARAAEPALSYDDMRRRLLDSAVREVYDSVTSARPAARLSAAVWGIYRNSAGWSNVATGYDARLQDSRGWTQQRIIDVIVPMIYWNIKDYGTRLDFAWLADDFAKAPNPRHVYIGMGAYAPTVDATFCVDCDVVAQIYRARQAGGNGVSVYSGQILRGANLWGALAAGPFKGKVPVPAMPWKP